MEEERKKNEVKWIEYRRRNKEEMKEYIYKVWINRLQKDEKERDRKNAYNKTMESVTDYETRI